MSATPTRQKAEAPKMSMSELDHAERIKRLREFSDRLRKSSKCDAIEMCILDMIGMLIDELDAPWAYINVRERMLKDMESALSMNDSRIVLADPLSAEMFGLPDKRG